MSSFYDRPIGWTAESTSAVGCQTNESVRQLVLARGSESVGVTVEAAGHNVATTTLLSFAICSGGRKHDEATTYARDADASIRGCNPQAVTDQVGSPFTTRYFLTKEPKPTTTFRPKNTETGPVNHPQAGGDRGCLIAA